MKRLLVGSFLCVASCVSSVGFAADNWPAWRGPLGNGTAPDGKYPVQWKIESGKDAQPGLKWHAALPGRGASTPAVWNDSIYVTTGAESKNWLIALDLQGKERWRIAAGEERAGKHKNGTGSNPSPVTDGEHVVAYFKSGDLICTDTQGKSLWSTNIQEHFEKDTLWWDLGTSPVIVGDVVVITVMQSGPSFLVAFDKSSGKQVWKTDRNLDAPEEAAQSYSTPNVLAAPGGDLLLVLGADHLTVHRAADGKELWKVGGFNPTQHQYFRSIASPVIAGDLVLCPYARGESLTAIRWGNDIPDEKRIAWQRTDLGSDVPTPTVEGNRAYILGDTGKLTCIDVETGKNVWQDSLPRSRLKFYSSPVLANGYLYLTREDAATFVVKAGDKFELVATNQVPGETVATPVFVNNTILFRTFDGIYCLGE